MRIAQEEIFGPILPVLAYDTLDDAIAIIRGGSRPGLAYAFGHDAAARRRLLAHTHSGGVTVNDWGWHVLNHDAPFGGGQLGHGHLLHGEGFRELSHARTVFPATASFPSACSTRPSATPCSAWCCGCGWARATRRCKPLEKTPHERPDLTTSSPALVRRAARWPPACPKTPAPASAAGGHGPDSSVLIHAPAGVGCHRAHPAEQLRLRHHCRSRA